MAAKSSFYCLQMLSVIITVGGVCFISVDETGFVCDAHVL